MSDLAPNTLEVGHRDGEVILNHPDLPRDARGVAHIIFSPEQARELAALLMKQADEAEAATPLPGGGAV